MRTFGPLENATYSPIPRGKQKNNTPLTSQKKKHPLYLHKKTPLLVKKITQHLF